MPNYQIIVKNPLTTDDQDLDAVIWIKAPDRWTILQILRTRFDDLETEIVGLPWQWKEKDGIEANLSTMEGNEKFFELLKNPNWEKG